MQTNLLGRLVEEGLSVALISPDSTDQNLDAYCSKNGVQMYQFAVPSTFWSSNYAKSRMYLMEDITKNPALLEKHLRATKMQTHRSVMSWVRPRILKAIHDLKKVLPSIKGRFVKREKKFLQSEKARNLLEEIAPRILIATYPVNYGEAMLLEASKTRIDTKSIIHLLSWDNISSKGHFPALADEYIAWGPIMKQEFQEYYGISDDKIHVTGVPHFDLHVQSRSQPLSAPVLSELGLDAEKPYLFFGMSSPRFGPKEIDIVEWLAQKIEGDDYGKDLQLIVRPHPQNVTGFMSDKSWLPRIDGLKSDRVAVDYPNLSKSKMPWSMQEHDMVRLSQLLAGASLSLNSGSTLSIDSLMCGTPVALTSFDADYNLPYWESARRLVDYTHLATFLASGEVKSTRSYDELDAEIRRFVSVASTPEKNLVHAPRTLQQMVYKADGEATERVVQVLRQLVKQDQVEYSE